MKSVVVAVVAGLILTGCGQAPQDPPSGSTVASVSQTFPQITPQVPPAQNPVPEKSVFSIWTANNENYYVDLTEAANPIVSVNGVFLVTRTKYFKRWNPGIDCRASITIQGTEDSGTIIVGNSTAAQGAYYNSYCDIIEGSFTYTRINEATLKLCIGNACRYWQ